MNYVQHEQNDVIKGEELIPWTKPMRILDTVRYDLGGFDWWDVHRRRALLGRIFTFFYSID